MSNEIENGMILPQAQDFEKAIIGACMLEKNAFDLAQQYVSEKMFYNENNAKIFAAIERLNAAGAPVDVLSISSELQKSKELDNVGGRHYLSEMTSNLASAAHLEYHCQIVMQKYISRELIRMAHQTQIRAFADIDDPDDILTEANRNIEQIMELIAGTTEDSSENIVKQSIKGMYERKKKFQEGLSVGITTGFVNLNHLTNGWQQEKLVILAARPAVGKTSVAIHFATRAAQYGSRVLFFSLEMGAVELMDKIITAYADVKPEFYTAGNINQEEINRVENIVNKVLDLPITIDDKPNVTVEKIISKARLMKKRNKCDMVIIDYLQLITPSSSRSNRNREQEVTEMSRKLKVAAKSLRVPFIVLCQLNRDIEKRGKNSEPQLSDLRESGAIEQDADMVIFIHRPEMYDDEAMQNYLELIIRKHRGGKIGKVRVNHNGNMNEFFDYNDNNQNHLV